MGTVKQSRKVSALLREPHHFIATGVPPGDINANRAAI